MLLDSEIPIPSPQINSKRKKTIFNAFSTNTTKKFKKLERTGEKIFVYVDYITLNMQIRHHQQHIVICVEGMWWGVFGVFGRGVRCVVFG